MIKTFITGAIVGTTMAASMSAAAMDYCAQSSKPDVCYGAQVRVLNGVRLSRNKKVSASHIAADKKKWWFQVDRQFVQWVDTRCNNAVCQLQNLESYNNQMYYKMQQLGVQP